MTPSDVHVVVLERDRHDDADRRAARGRRTRNLIRDGDVAPSIAAAQPGTGVDLLYGIGGTPEGVISAAALKCVGGGIQGRLWPRNDDERRELVDAGLDPDARAARPTTWSRATTSSSPPPASPAARSCAASATRPTARSPTRS